MVGGHGAVVDGAANIGIFVEGHVEFVCWGGIDDCSIGVKHFFTKSVSG